MKANDIDNIVIKVKHKKNPISTKSVESSLGSVSTNTDDVVKTESDLESKEKRNNENETSSATKNDKTRRELRERWTKYSRYFKRMHDYLIRAEMTHPYITRAKDIATKYKSNDNSLQPQWASNTCKLKSGVTIDAVKEGINVVVRCAIKMNDKHISFRNIDDKNWSRFNEDIIKELKPAQSLMDVKAKEIDVRCGSYTTDARQLTNLVAGICNDKFFAYTISDIFKMRLIPLLKTLNDEASAMADNPGWDKNNAGMTAVSDCVVMVKSIVETMKVCIGSPLQVCEAALKESD